MFVRFSGTTSAAETVIISSTASVTGTAMGLRDAISDVSLSILSLSIYILTSRLEIVIDSKFYKYIEPLG